MGSRIREVKEDTMTEVPLKSGEFHNALDIGLIKIKEGHNPRQDATPDSELVHSIMKAGIIRPITVRKENGGFSIIDGERRFRAAKEIGFKSIPAIDRGEMDDKTALMEAVISNRNQLTFTPEEQFSAFTRLEEGGYSKSEISEYLGIGINKVREYMKIRKRGTKKLKESIAAPKKERVEVRSASQIAALPKQVQDELVDKVKGKPQKESLDIISKRKQLLGGKGPVARKKLPFRRPKDDIPPPVYKLADDAAERCRTVENETHRRIRVKGRNAEFRAYLDIIDVLKGSREPMSLFG